MPQITEYNAGDLGIRPSETGIESVAGAARRINAAYNEAADLKRETGRRLGNDIQVGQEAASDYVSHQEISRASGAIAGLRAAKTKEWADISANADPNDTTVAQNFIDNSLNPSLEQFRNGFLTDKGQAWADQQIAHFRDHMETKTAADMSSAAGHAVAINHAQTVNGLSNEVYTDPSSLPNALDALDHATGGVVATSPNLNDKAGVKSRLVEEGKAALVKSAVLGSIDKNGKVPDWASDPQYSKYINVAEIRQFEKAAHVQSRAMQIQDKQYQQLQKQQNEEAVTNANNKNFTDNVKFDEDSGQVIVDPKFTKNAIDIAKMPGADARTQRATLDWAEHKLNPKTVPTDQIVKGDLLTRMTDPDNPTSRVQILEAETQGKLSSRDGASLRRLYDELEKSPLKDPVMKSTLAGVKQLLGTDPVGAGKYASFMQDFIPQYLDAKRKNTLPPNALDIKDPKSLISQVMAPYQRDALQIMTERALRAPSAPQSAPAGMAPVRVTTPAEAQALTPGTRYVGPDGRTRIR